MFFCFQEMELVVVSSLAAVVIIFAWTLALLTILSVIPGECTVLREFSSVALRRVQGISFDDLLSYMYCPVGSPVAHVVIPVVGGPLSSLPALVSSFLKPWKYVSKVAGKRILGEVIQSIGGQTFVSCLTIGIGLHLSTCVSIDSESLSERFFTAIEDHITQTLVSAIWSRLTRAVLVVVRRFPFFRRMSWTCRSWKLTTPVVFVERAGWHCILMRATQVEAC